MTSDTAKYILWNDPNVEHGAGPEEDAIIRDIANMINESQQRVFDQHHHAFTGTHVKTHGVMKGTMEIKKDLPEHLAQSIFANGGKRHDVAVRFSTETMNLISDTVPQPRGLAVKVFSVDGEKLKPNAPSTQDFEFNSAPVIELANAQTCRDIIALRLQYTDAEEHKRQLKKRQDFDVQDARNHGPLTHVFLTRQYSQSAFRYGKYVAKFAVTPTRETQSILSANELDASVDKGKPFDAVGSRGFRQGLIDALQEQQKSLTYDFQVQLLQDLDEQDIEDARNEWNEEKYPFTTVATIVIPPQDPFLTDRTTFWRNNIRLDPWHGRTDLQPLGSINRVRKIVYPASAAFRRRANGHAKEILVDNIDQIPDT